MRTSASHSLVFSEIRIENTNHCGYRCHFCPRERMTRPRGVMSIGEFNLVLERIGKFSGQVDLHGYGEPLLDKELIQKVSIAAGAWPDARIRLFSTLGVRVGAHYFSRLIDAGLGHMEVSLYGDTPAAYREVHGVDCFHTATRNLERLCVTNRERGAPVTVVMRDFPVHPEVKRPDTGDQCLNGFRKRWLDAGVKFIRQRAMHNYGEGRTYNAPGTRHPCSIVWGYRKRILQISWDLDVIPCCFDFDSRVVFGNLRHQTLEEIFSGSTYLDFISAHAKGTLENYNPCLNCERCTQL